MYADSELFLRDLDELLRPLPKSLLLDKGAEALARYGPRRAASTAACGIVLAVWRDPLEDLHSSFSDAEMALMSIQACTALRWHVHDYPRLTSELQWPEIARILGDPKRDVLESATGPEVFGTHWAQVKRTMEVHCALAGPDYGLVRVGDVLYQALAHCVDWYGAPLWPRIVRRFCAEVEVPSNICGGDVEALRATLLDNPARLGADGFGWCLQNRLGAVLGRLAAEALDDFDPPQTESDDVL